MKKSILLFICSVVFYYLSTAFVQLDLNPANWTDATRLFVVIMVTMTNAIGNIALHADI